MGGPFQRLRASSRAARIRATRFSRSSGVSRRRSGSIGTSHATGLPRLVMTTDSPFATASSRPDRWVLAPNDPT